MLKVDEKFLQEIGLSDMPEEQKTKLMASAQEELERRVGEKLSDGMTLAQLQEFDGIAHNDRDTMATMLAKCGDYKEDVVMKKLLERHGKSEIDLEIMNEYLSIKWIQMNRPDYRKIATEVMDEIKNEILNSRSKLLA